MAEQSDEHGELIARHHGRREHHDPREHRPFAHASEESVFTKGLQRHGEHGQSVAEAIGDGHAECFERADHGESAQGGGSLRAARAVNRAAHADAQQSDGKNQSERKRRTAEQWTQHPVPDEFEQEEDEPDHGGGETDEFRRSRQRNAGAALDRSCGMAFRRFRCVRAAAREEAGEQGDCEIERARQPEREPVTEMFQHPEGRQHGAGDSAEGVRGIEPGHAPAGGVALIAHRAHCGRQGAAHEKGRASQDNRGQDQAQRRAHDHAQAEGASEREIEFAGEQQQERRQRGAQGDEPFEASVGAEGIRPAVRLASEKITAQPHAAHEHCADRCRGRGGSAEDEAEFAQPDRLVNQRAQARAK